MDLITVFSSLKSFPYKVWGWKIHHFFLLSFDVKLEWEQKNWNGNWAFSCLENIKLTIQKYVYFFYILYDSDVSKWKNLLNKSFVCQIIEFILRNGFCDFIYLIEKDGRFYCRLNGLIGVSWKMWVCSS